MVVKEKRVIRMQQMVLEMVSGNFFYRLEHQGENDGITGVEMALNMLSEELQEYVSQELYRNSKGTSRDVVQMSYLVDARGIVIMASEQACSLLNIPIDEIVGSPFENVLTEESKKRWRDTLKAQGDITLALEFVTKEALRLPNSSHITTFKGSTGTGGQTLVTVIVHSKLHYEMEKDLKKRVMEFGTGPNSETGKKSTRSPLVLNSEDIKKITKAHDIIINNPEKKLPNLKDFALELGTNEFKLKNGFKELYGTSVHRFLIDERLKKVITLVQYSEHSLKHIAQLTGFKSYPHFSRTFKNRYGYSAGQLRKRVLEDKKNNILRLTPLEHDISNRMN